MSPFPPVSSHASARSIRYEIVGQQPAEGYPERFTIDLSEDGRAQLTYEHGPIRQSWSARTEGIVSTRLLKAMESMPSGGATEDLSPREPVHRRLQVFGAAPLPRTVTWDEGADSVRAGAILDSLIAQISGVRSNLVANTLPR